MTTPIDNNFSVQDSDSAVRRSNHLGSSRNPSDSALGRQSHDGRPPNFSAPDFARYNSFYIVHKSPLLTKSSLKVLQWNLKDYVNNYDHLNILIKEHLPCVISLQETHCPFQSVPLIPKSYVGYFNNLPSNVTSKQGIGV